MFKLTPLELTSEIPAAKENGFRPIEAPQLKADVSPFSPWGGGIWEFSWKSYPGNKTEVVIKEAGTKRVVYHSTINCTWCVVELSKVRKHYLVLMRSITSCGSRQSPWIEFSFNTDINTQT